MRFRFASLCGKDVCISIIRCGFDVISLMSSAYSWLILMCCEFNVFE